MNSLQVFDPAMCCSSGVCGPEVDSQLVRFAADLKALASQGVTVERYNLAQTPLAFAENEVVCTALTEKGEAALPLLLLDGRIVASGGYPDRASLARILGIVTDTPALEGAAKGCGCAGCC